MLALASTGSAVVNLVYTGTVDSDATGTYSPGNAIAITFTLSPEANAGSGQFSSTASANVWGTELTSEASTWSSVTSTSLGGTWAEGSFDGNDPRDSLSINAVGPNDLFAFSTGIDSGTTTGLTLGGNQVTSIQISGLLDGFTGTYSLGGYTNPSDYLTVFAATYAATSVGGTIQTAGGDLLINGGTLEIVVVPESNYVSLILVFALCLGMIRRRR